MGASVESSVVRRASITTLLVGLALVVGGCGRGKEEPQRSALAESLAHLCEQARADTEELGPGDSVYIDRDVVHGSFNESDETAELQVILAPASGDGGYELVDVSGDEPWVSKR